MMQTAPSAPSAPPMPAQIEPPVSTRDRKSTRLNSSHLVISYAVFCLKKNREQTKTGFSPEIEAPAAPPPALQSRWREPPHSPPAPLGTPWLHYIREPFPTHALSPPPN